MHVHAFFHCLLSFPCMKLCLHVLRLHRRSYEPSTSRQTYYTNLSLSPGTSVGLYSTRNNLWAWLAKGFSDIIHNVHLNAKNVGPPPTIAPTRWLRWRGADVVVVSIFCQRM